MDLYVCRQLLRYDKSDQIIWHGHDSRACANHGYHDWTLILQ